MSKPIDADEIKRLRLKKGDILVLQLGDDHLSDAQAQAVKGRVYFILQQAGMHTLPVLILTKGQSISVYDASNALKEAAAAQPAPVREVPAPAAQPNTAAAIRAELDKPATVVEAGQGEDDGAAFA